MATGGFRRRLGEPPHAAGDELGVAYERHGVDLVSPAEVAFRVARLRILAKSAVALARGEAIAQWWSLEDDTAAEDLARTEFLEAINSALGAFPVRVHLGGEAVGTTPVTAYSVACLQIANNIAARVAYLTCGVRRAGEPSPKQRGRAVNGEHHTKALRFCSRTCALAQTQRERRRRARSEPAGATLG